MKRNNNFHKRALTMLTLCVFFITAISLESLAGHASEYTTVYENKDLIPEIEQAGEVKSEFSLFNVPQEIAAQRMYLASAEYEIGSAAELVSFANMVNSGQITANASLTSDIDLSGIVFTPIGNYISSSSANYYSGTFNGNGYTISNISVNTYNDGYSGLFGYIGTTGVVKDFTIEGASAAAYAGGVAGYNKGTISNVKCLVSVFGGTLGGGIAAYNTNKISECINKNSIRTSSGIIGGIAGYNSAGAIENCINKGYVEGDFFSKLLSYSKYTGGICGQNSGTISNSSNSGRVNGGEYVGGIVGYQSGTLTTIINSGEINAYNRYAGGIFGGNSSATGTVTNAKNYGDINAKSYVGGIAGNCTQSISNAENYGAISAGDTRVGGIAGNTTAPVFNSINYASISGKAYVAGIAGYGTGDIDNCQNNGKITGSDHTAGIVSITSKVLTRCSNYGDITGVYKTGGIFGESYGTTSKCSNFGNIVGTDGTNGNHTGGIGGLSNGTSSAISDSISVCSVTGLWNKGGIIGRNNGGLSNSIYAGTGLMMDPSSSGANINNYILSTVSPENLTNGLLAWKLNTINGTVANRRIWSQGDVYPILADENHKAVYKVDFTLDGTTQTVYSNATGCVTISKPQSGNIIWRTSDDTVINGLTQITDDIAVAGTPSTQELTQEEMFIYSYANVLALSNALVSSGDYARISECMVAFDTLSDMARGELADKKAHLDMLFATVNTLIKTANITNETQLVAAIAENQIETIVLKNSFAITAPAVITKKLTIIGNNNQLSNADTVFDIQSANVNIRDIAISGEYGIKVSGSSLLTLDGFIDFSACQNGVFVEDGIVNVNSNLLTKNDETNLTPVLTASTSTTVNGTENLSANTEAGVVRYFTVAANISSVSNAINAVVTTADNVGVANDIYPTYFGAIAYFFLPSKADLSNITYYTVDKNGTKLNKYIINALSGSDSYVTIDGYVFKIIAKQSKLPTLYFDIHEENGTIKSMNTSPDNSVKCFGDVRLEVPAPLVTEKGWKSSFISTENKIDSPGTMEIKGRGNSTWDISPTMQKPYQFKLEKKNSLLNKGTAKTWVIVRCGQPVILNKLGLDIGKDMGIQYTPDSEFVEAFMNGNYIGMYMLSEKVEVDPERVNITNIDDAFEKSGIAGTDLTGGYLLEVDNNSDPLQFKIGSYNTVTVKSPEDIDTSATSSNNYKYIVNFTTDLFNAIYSDSGLMPDGRSYLDYIDIESFVRYYWQQEFITNTDCGRGSTYIYKDSNSKNPLFRAGPIWDSDCAFKIENQSMWRVATLNKTDTTPNTPMLYNALMKRKEFVSYVIWYYEHSNITNVFANSTSFVDQYEKVIIEAIDMNRIKWGYTASNISSVRAYLTTRASWINTHIAELRTLATKGEFINVDSQMLRNVLIDKNAKTTFVRVFNNKTAALTSNVVICAYKGEHLVSLQIKPVNALAGQAFTDIRFDYPIDEYETIKIFVWNEMNQLTPLCDGYKFKNK